MDLADRARSEIAELNPFWPQPLLFALAAQGPEVPFAWVEQGLRGWLPNSSSPRWRELVTDLDLLPGRLLEDTGGDLLIEQAREIWYRPHSDAAQVAVSKLYGAWATRQRGNQRQALLQLSAPLNLMLWPDRLEPAESTTVDLLLELYQRHSR